MSFESILVANRGEIALRAIEACRELGIRSVVVYSEADAEMPYRKLADASVCIGPAAPAKSYLNIASIISAADLIGIDAIHPGYGFLAENPHFVEVCEDHDITFIGPRQRTMELLGDKVAAREAVMGAGVPVLPGGPAPEDADTLISRAAEIGYPVLIKSVYGGGGRGMRWIEEESELVAATSAAAAEAKGASGDASLYLEKAIPEPRHIEVQVFADETGRVVHLGERECSIQRRHQKLIEESPAPNLREDVRQRLHQAALTAAQAVGYRNAGTVEFILDGDETFYFIEMNARIQVEHSVSEVVTGTNLIKEQIRIAQGEELSWTQEDVRIDGHAIECRLNAEDPTRGFLPSTGTVTLDELPGGNGIRLDTILYQGMPVTPFYDSLLAKLIGWGETREEAIARTAMALQRFRVSGISSTRDIALEIVRHPVFARGEQTTRFIDRFLSDIA